MANINKITVNGTTYDIEDTTARSSTGLTADIKQALLDCFENVAWINANGQTYYDALETALYPPANLSSITCVYTQSGTVYDTDSLDSLKSDLVVTAHYDNSTTQTVTTYTLSGTLTTGTSTITVTYGGKTTTFNVTVTAMPYVTDGLIAYWDAIDNTGSGHDGNATKWIDKVEGYELPILDSTTTWDTDAIVFTGTAPQGLKANAFWSGLTSDSTIEVVFKTDTTNTQVVALLDTSDTATGNYYDSKSLCIYNDGTVGFLGNSGNTYTNPNAHTSIRKAVATYSNFTVTKALINGSELSLSSKSHSFRAGARNITVGSMDPTKSTQSYNFDGKIHAIRVYDKQLSANELNQNLLYDNARFNLGLTL